MTPTAKQVKEIQNQFNKKAEQLGCRARIGGTAKRPKQFKMTGYTEDGHEILYPINGEQFGQLISKYPELQD